MSRALPRSSGLYQNLEIPLKLADPIVKLVTAGTRLQRRKTC